MDHLIYLESQIELFNQRIQEAARPFEKAIHGFDSDAGV